MTWQSGYQARAKADTVFLGESATGTLSELATDLSQEATDLSYSATTIYENSTTRVSAVRGTMEVHVGDDTTGGTETLGRCSDGTNVILFGRNTSGGGQLRGEFHNSGGNIALTLDISSLLTGTEAEFYYGLSWEPNPDTTGATDATRAHLIAIRKSDGATLTTSGDVRQPGTFSGASLSFFATSSGGSAAFHGTEYKARLSEACHPPEETYQDFYAEDSADTINGTETFELPVPDFSGGLANETEFVSIPSAVAGAVRQHARRLVSPLWSDVYENPTTFGQDEADFSTFALDEWRVDAPGSSDFEIPLGFLFRVPVPPTINRVVGKAVVTIGAQLTAETELRLYSMSAVPQSQSNSVSLGGGGQSSFTWHAGTKVGTGTTAGTATLALPACQIARDAKGHTYLALGFNIPTGATDDDGLTLDSLTIEGISLITTGPVGGLANP